MSKLSRETIEKSAKLFRIQYLDTDLNSPIDTKTALTKLGILTVFRPLSDKFCGLSLKSMSGDKFILINSNNNVGRQHFTIAHELYHLFYDEKFEPHICIAGAKGVEESNADAFASALLMPEEGIIQQLGNDYVNGIISMATLLRTERLYGVSHEALLIRLRKLNIITESTYQDLKLVNITQEAARYGHDTSLYRPGNEGLYIGTLGEMAKKEFDRGKISEGYYLEILNMLSRERAES